MDGTALAPHGLASLKCFTFPLPFSLECSTQQPSAVALHCDARRHLLTRDSASSTSKGSLLIAAKCERELEAQKPHAPEFSPGRRLLAME